MEKEEILLKPGQQIKPVLSNENVEMLVKKLYNLEVTSIKELNSYDDRNFLITVANNENLPDVNERCRDGYILKVLNTLDSKAGDLVEAQNEMMLYLGRCGISCPKPVKNVHGKLTSLEKILPDGDVTLVNNNDEGSTNLHMVRLLTYIPGDILFSVEYTADLFFQVGVLVAKLGLALKDFKNEALENVQRVWNLSSVPKLKSFLYAVPNDENRALAQEVIDNFEKKIVPQYDQLSRGVIHGDLNEQNILVAEVADSPGKYRVAGVIDFGDVHVSCCIFELAIAICYMMIECKLMDILEAPGHVLAGYMSIKDISELEFQILKAAVSGRFCQSLVLGAYSYSVNPDPYVLTTSKRGWDCLKKLWSTPEDQLYKKWQEIIASYSA